VLHLPGVYFLFFFRASTLTHGLGMSCMFLCTVSSNISRFLVSPRHEGCGATDFHHCLQQELSSRYLRALAELKQLFVKCLCRHSLHPNRNKMDILSYM
jgi:hypothetical protein